VCTIASVLGGLLGYAIGLFLFDTVGEWILNVYGYTEEFQQVQAIFDTWGFWFVFAAGFTPLPYKVITITSGVLSLNPAVFLVASTVSRGGRFFLISLLLYHYGPPIRRFIEGNLPMLTIVFVVVLFAGFLAVRYVF
jgi:membrane protein YqaA with SNARE-associated domain